MKEAKLAKEKFELNTLITKVSTNPIGSCGAGMTLNICSKLGKRAQILDTLISHCKEAASRREHGLG